MLNISPISIASRAKQKIKQKQSTARIQVADMAFHDAQEKARMLYQDQKVVKVHIGCGPRVIKGWLNMDLAFEPYENYLQYYTDIYFPAEIRGDQNDFIAVDITKKGIPLPDGCTDVVFHEDFLEHLSQRDQVVFLAESWRILKPGGIHRINTPDLVTSMLTHSSFEKGMAGVYLQEWEKHGHINVSSQAILREMAHMIGYSQVLFNSRNQSESKLLPLEYRPDPKDRPEDGNIFADLIK